MILKFKLISGYHRKIYIEQTNSGLHIIITGEGKKNLKWQKPPAETEPMLEQAICLLNWNSVIVINTDQLDMKTDRRSEKEQHH